VDLGLIIHAALESVLVVAQLVTLQIPVVRLVRQKVLIIAAREVSGTQDKAFSFSFIFGLGARLFGGRFCQMGELVGHFST
jgi:hypothetical protein